MGQNVGQYAIRFDPRLDAYGFDKNFNYAIDFVPNIFRIVPRPITVTVPDALRSKEFDGTLPAIDRSKILIDNRLDCEDVSQFIIFDFLNESRNMGTYIVTFECANNNYMLVGTAGDFTFHFNILQRQISQLDFTLPGVGAVYTSDTFDIGVHLFNADIATGDTHANVGVAYTLTRITLDGSHVSTDTVRDAGRYIITVMGIPANSNYTIAGELTAEFVIARREIVIKFDDSSLWMHYTGGFAQLHREMAVYDQNMQGINRNWLFFTVYRENAQGRREPAQNVCGCRGRDSGLFYRG
jgi:hypothetical protein